MELENLVIKYVSLLVKYQEMKKNNENQLDLQFLEEEKNIAYNNFINKIFVSNIDEITSFSEFLVLKVNSLYQEIEKNVKYRNYLYNLIVKGNTNLQELLDNLIEELKRYENIIYALNSIKKNIKIYKK